LSGATATVIDRASPAGGFVIAELGTVSSSCSLDAKKGASLIDRSCPASAVVRMLAGIDVTLLLGGESSA
jgi:hypothetical protein